MSLPVLKDDRECPCGRGWYDGLEFTSCYECYLDRRADYVACIWCGAWHAPQFDSCYRCRSDPDRDEASGALRRMVLARDRFACRYCGTQDDLMQIDHIKPCAEGGTADPWNLQTLCGPCNRAKGATWWVGCRHDKARERSVHAYSTYLWQYLTPDEQDRLWTEVRDWLQLAPIPAPPATHHRSSP